MLQARCRTATTIAIYEPQQHSNCYHASHPVQSNPMYPLVSLAEVPANELVEEAQAAAKRDPCRILQAIAGIKRSSADAPLHKILWDSGLTLGLEIATTKISTMPQYPYLDPKSFLEYVAGLGLFHGSWAAR